MQMRYSDLNFISCFIPGLARPKGSKRAIPIYRGKRGQPREFTGKATVVESAGSDLKAWEHDIRAAMMVVMKGRPLFTGPIYLALTFVRLKAKSAKKSDSPYPIKRPDRLKLARAVEDALTGIVWRDDAQVVSGPVEKRFGDPPGVHIVINPCTALND